VVHPSCVGSSNASISIQSIQGQAPFAISWSTGDSLNVLSGLSEGMYYLNVSDSEGCLYADSFEIIEPDSLAFQVNIIRTNSFPFYSVEIIPQGGTPAYSVVWADGDTGLIRNNFSDNQVEFTLIDQNSCLTGGLVSNIPLNLNELDEFSWNIHPNPFVDLIRIHFN
jgi:hypothetical protein